MRTLSVASAFLALSSAFMFYAVNYDTRILERKLYAEQKKRDRLRGDNAVLKAERAHLARPERIEPLARKLGLAPLSEEQIVESLKPGLLEQDNTVVTGSTKPVRR